MKIFGSKKNPEKFELMAALFILGGYIPLDVSIVTNHGFNFSGCNICLVKNSLFVLAMIIGGLSLLFTRGSPKWRLNVQTRMGAFFGPRAQGVSTRLLRPLLPQQRY